VKAIGFWDVEAPTFSRQSAHRWRWGCQPYAPTTLYLQEDSWYSFLLVAELIPGPYAAGRIRSIEKKSNNLIGNRTRDLPACSIVPQPTTLPRAPGVLVINSLIYSPSNSRHVEHRAGWCSGNASATNWGGSQMNLGRDTDYRGFLLSLQANFMIITR
jgi:hypothetical protein